MPDDKEVKEVKKPDEPTKEPKRPSELSEADLEHVAGGGGCNLMFTDECKLTKSES